MQKTNDRNTEPERVLLVYIFRAFIRKTCSLLADTYYRGTFNLVPDCGTFRLYQEIKYLSTFSLGKSFVPILYAYVCLRIPDRRACTSGRVLFNHARNVIVYCAWALDTEQSR